MSAVAALANSSEKALLLCLFLSCAKAGGIKSEPINVIDIIIAISFFIFTTPKYRKRLYNYYSLCAVFFLLFFVFFSNPGPNFVAVIIAFEIVAVGRFQNVFKCPVPCKQVMMDEQLVFIKGFVE